MVVDVIVSLVLLLIIKETNTATLAICGVQYPLANSAPYGQFLPNHINLHSN